MPKVYGDGHRPLAFSSPKEATASTEPIDPTNALHEALRDAVEDIEDFLADHYRITANVEIADGGDRARLVYRRTGEPPRWAIFLTPPGAAAVQFGSAPLRWRCAAVRALPELLVELQKERRAADESLNAAVHAATAFRDQLLEGKP